MNPIINELSFTLHIEVDDVAHSKKKQRKIIDMSIDEIRMFPETDEKEIEPVILNKDDLQQIGYENHMIILTNNETGTRKTFKSANKTNFTIGEIINCILEFERIDRPNTNWFGAPDSHHIFFEGLMEKGDNIYEIMWGS